MKTLAPLGIALLLAACAGTDNSPVPTPLAEVKNTVRFEPAWKASLGSGKLFRFAPAQGSDAVYMASVDSLGGFAQADGRKLFDAKADKPLAGGIGAGSGILVAGTLKGDVLAYDLAGKLKWQARVSSEVVAPPVVVDGVVVVRSIDGRVAGLDAATGANRWQFQRSQPSLVLRTYSPVAVADGNVFVGMAAGRLAALSASDGKVLWESTVAQPKGATELERLSDVSSTPAIDRGTVCAVAFQGKVACFATSNGTMLWSREISSYVGLAIDSEAVYVTDEVGNVQAFDRTGGRSLWKQTALYGRRVSAPVIWNGQLAVGDFEGVIHLLAPSDGRFVARQNTDKSRVLVAPRVIGERLLVQTESGGLFAFTAK
ncbi:outer membrane protein assembly factor BamB [Chitinimonas sp.]|uniref:outer membrane protein assembly factor BamB n=1 Tax=Chitinimonas sp. TaxID=1934313 RepID=UPI0035B21790